MSARRVSGITMDGHHDIYYLNELRRAGVEHPLASDILPRWRGVGLDMIVYAFAGDSQLHVNKSDLPLRGALENLEEVREEVADTAGRVRLVRWREDLPVRPSDVFSLMLTIEGGRPLEGRVPLLRTFFELGVRMVQPMWNYRNELGDGAMELETGGGLSRAGVDIVREMNRLGMVVDVAHAAPRGFWQMLEVNQGPLVCSHANSAAVTPHPRNLADDQLRAVAQTGGVIGLQHSPGRIDPTHPTLSKMLDHLDHMVQTAGVDHVGIGLDLSGRLQRRRPPKDETFASKEPTVLDGFETLAEFPHLIDGIFDRGYSDADVDKIAGGNFLRVFRQVLPARPS